MSEENEESTKVVEEVLGDESIMFGGTDLNDTPVQDPAMYETVEESPAVTKVVNGQYRMKAVQEPLTEGTQGLINSLSTQARHPCLLKLREVILHNIDVRNDPTSGKSLERGFYWPMEAGIPECMPKTAPLSSITKAGEDKEGQWYFIAITVALKYLMKQPGLFQAMFNGSYTRGMANEEINTMLETTA